MNKALLSLFVSFTIQSADKLEIKTILANPGEVKVHSLQSLACNVIALQINQVLNNNPSHVQKRALLDGVNLLPPELHDPLKRKLAPFLIDRLTNIHTVKPIYPPKDYPSCVSPDGTLLAYYKSPCSFIVKNLDTQQEIDIEDTFFLEETEPFITKNNTFLFFSRWGVSTYCPQTKKIQGTFSGFISKLWWASDDLKKLFFSTLNGNFLYDVEKNTQTRIPHLRAHVDNDYITTFSDRFHCYSTHDGSFYMEGDQGTGQSIISFPQLICTRKTLPTETDPTSLEIWNIPNKQPIRRITLPGKIDELLACKTDRVEILSEGSFCVVNIQNGAYKKRDYFSEKKEESEYFTRAENSLLVRTYDPNFPSKYYVVNLLTRKLTIPLIELNGTDVTSCYFSDKRFTRIGGKLEGYVPFVYTTPLHTLYHTPLPELFEKLLSPA